MILFYFPVDLLLFFFSATKKSARPSDFLYYHIQRLYYSPLFLRKIAPPQKSSNESRSAIESYYVTRLQVPLRSPVWYTNKRCVFNYLPLHVTIDPSIIIFSQVSILLLLYHDHYTQEKKAHSAPLSSSLW